MKKNNFIYLKGEFDSKMIAYLKEQIRFIDLAKDIIVRVNSCGGNAYPMTVMSALLYYMIKYKNCKIIIEIEHAESSAFLFSVNFPTRRVLEISNGIIHLPVITPGEELSEIDLGNKIKETINFISNRTKLNPQEIIELNGKTLPGKEMAQMGIAELVEQFSSQPLNTI